MRSTRIGSPLHPGCAAGGGAGVRTDRRAARGLRGRDWCRTDDLKNLGHAAAQAAAGLFDLAQFHRADAEAITRQCAVLFVGSVRLTRAALIHTRASDNVIDITGEGLLLRRCEPDRAVAICLGDGGGTAGSLKPSAAMIAARLASRISTTLV